MHVCTIYHHHQTGCAYFESSIGANTLTSRMRLMKPICISEAGAKHPEFQQPNHLSRLGWCFGVSTYLYWSIWDERFCFKSFTAFFLPLELFEHLAEIFKKPNGTQICFTAKAYNGRVLSQWLADCLRDAISKHYHDDHEQLPLLASCMFLGLKGE